MLLLVPPVGTFLPFSRKLSITVFCVPSSRITPITDIPKLQQANAKRWAVAKITRSTEYNTPVARALAAKDRYKAIEVATGVSWVFIAIAHYRECSQNFSLSLAQGDDWSKVSRHVPAGRGPFKSFEEAAVDALVNCPPYASHNKDWSLPGMLTIEELYNGPGYANRGVPSPYIWSGTDQYTRGKYVADGVYDPNTVDKQLGAAGFILSLAQRDPSIVSHTPVAPTLPPLTQIAPTASPDLPERILDWLKTH